MKYTKMKYNLIRRGIRFLAAKHALDWMPDRLYLQLKYWATMGKKLNLDNPHTFNEKLQWLKLNNKCELYPTIVDKNEVKKYITQELGEQYVIPTIGVWDHFDDIDFEQLPEQFVLKCTHDSGGLIICRDKKSLDKDAAKKKIEKSLRNKYFYLGREWPYKNVKPRIIAEPYMEDKNEKELRDYKFFCFDGYVDNVMLAMDRNTGDTKFYFFDPDWNFLRINIRGKNAPKDFTLPKPKGMDEMVAIARKLSVGMPFVRVDLYYCNDQVYFGELTFFPQNGFDANLLPETDDYLGRLIDLKKVKIKKEG